MPEPRFFAPRLTEIERVDPAGAPLVADVFADVPLGSVNEERDIPEHPVSAENTKQTPTETSRLNIE